MSSRKGKKSETKPAAKPAKEGPKRPSGRVPMAMVSSRHGTDTVTRLGRGFSFGELAGAGLAPRLASKWGVSVDLRRRSVLEHNVSSLKSWGGHAAPAKKREGRVKKVEEELEKVEEGVKKEVAEVKEEVEKVEKEVKTEAAKAEKAVRRRAAKPKKKEE